MLPEIGGSEIILILVVALLVVGPKDLPLMLRKFGQFMARLRGMAAEFRASFDEMARQSELDDLRREVEAMRRGQLADQAAHEASNTGVDQIFNEIGDSLSGSGIQFHPPMSHQYIGAPEPEPTQVEPAPPPALEPAPARKPRARRAAKPPAGSAA